MLPIRLRHVLKHRVLQGITEMVKEACRPQMGRRSSTPHVLYEFLVGLTKESFLRVGIRNPGIRMFIQEYRQIWNMPEALYSGIQETGRTHILKTDLTFLHLTSGDTIRS
jgi:hypothetical protein